MRLILRRRYRRVQDPRSFATHAVGAAIAIVALAFLVAGGLLLFRGSPFLGLVALALGVVVLLAAGAFLLVPSAVDELGEPSKVEVKEE